MHKSRVNGILAVSRGFGDYDLKLVDKSYDHNGPVSSIPEIIMTDLSKIDNETILIMGSDGLFDAFETSQDVYKTCNLSEFETISLNLVNHAKIRNYNDDTTALIVKFQNGYKYKINE